MNKTYRYEALDRGLSQLRVFSLFAASDHNAPLRGKLQTEQLSPTPPVYEAISYVWGEKEGEEMLEVDGKELMITSNLASVLKRVRHQDRIRYLWMDAVCIDQGSPEEKSHQVRKMRQIYSSASRVLIWLGDEDLSKDFTYTMEHLERLQQEGFDRCKLNGLQINHRTRSLFQCRWWKRVWTIQEGVVANEHTLVLWGSREISWAYIIDLVEYINSSLRAYRPRISWEHRASGFARVYREYHLSGTIPLEKLIYVSFGRNASDPRDMIYALLGLVKQPSFTPLEPNYTQSTEWAFQRAIISVITARKDLEFLLNIVMARSSVNGVENPSWGYDFTKRTVALRRDVRDFLFRCYRVAPEGASTGRSFLNVQHNAQASSIKITGTIVGSVVEAQMIHTDCYSKMAERTGKTGVGFFAPFPCRHLNAFVPWLLQTLQDFTLVARRAWSKRFPPEKVKAKTDRGDVWRIAAHGLGPDDLALALGGEPQFPEVAVDGWEIVQRHSTLDAWRRILAQENSGSPENVESRIAKSSYRDIVRMFSSYEYWQGCLFTTMNGYVAYSIKEAQVGDLVCILFGCAMPLVLRPQDDETYKIIHSAYVGDIMNGEFLQDKADYTDVEFVIS
jgi:hypothetical protein